MLVANPAGGNTFKVWDAPLRLFHWLLVAAITAAFLSSEGDSPIAAWHMAAGWVAAVLLAFRLIWGFVGGEHARFVNFIRPSGIVAHIRGLVTGHPERTVGHNPLGALAVLALFAAVGAVLWTGIQVDAGKADEDIHEALAYGMLALVGIHVAAVLVMSLVTRDNLARAMVTGRKRTALYPGARDARVPGFMAVVLGGVVVIAAVFGITRFDPAAFSPQAHGEAGEGQGGEYTAAGHGENPDGD